MKFDENWYSELKLKKLRHTARRVKGLQGAVMEVGAWQGRSTVAIMEEVYPAIVHVVDTWAGSPNDESSVLASKRDVLAEFRANADEAGGNYCVHQSDWRDVFADWALDIRFIHIDGTHTYQEVYDNVQTVLPLMVPGGIVCGDDASATWPEVTRAVRACFPSEADYGPDGFWWVKR